MKTSKVNQNKKCLYFGAISKKMLIPLLIPILYSIRHYTLDTFDLRLRDANNDIKQQSIFINTFILSITYSLNFILYIVETRNSKVKNLNVQEKKFDNQLLIEKMKREKRKKSTTRIYLILLAFFNFFNYLFYDIIGMFKPSNYNKLYFYTLSIPFFFIITALMSFLFLNKNIYKHQYITMIISPILSISLLLIIKFLNLGKRNNTAYAVLYLMECLGLRGLRFILDVLGKLIMEKRFVTYFRLMTFLGIFGLLFSIIFSFASYFIDFSFIKDPALNNYFIIQDGSIKRLKNIFDSWGSFDSMNIILFITIILIWFIENFLIWFSIYAFSPNHYTVYASLNTIVVLFIDVVIDEFKTKNIIIKIVFSIALFGMLICGLIFNEILIIGLWSMNKYTAKEIMRRQKEEMEKNPRISVELSESSDSNRSSTKSRMSSLDFINI
jgi:hypothetical protein